MLEVKINTVENVAHPHQTVVIGPLPPPFGGISVYLHRLKASQPGYEFIDEKTLPPRRLLGLLLTRNKHYEYHPPNWRRRLFFYFLSLFTNNTYTIVCHGQSLEESYNECGRLGRFFMRKMLARAEVVRVVNPKAKEFLTRELPRVCKRISVKHAFLPPPAEDEARIWKTYTAETCRFVDDRDPLIVANACQITFSEGIDLYGLDMCVELMSQLKARYPNIGLLFGLPRIGDDVYFRTIKERIEELEIVGNIHFVTGQKEIWPLFHRADLMVRPTSQDGYGISIAEALYLGCPAIASDVCQRAEGTVLFRNRDSADLLRKANSVLAGFTARTGSRAAG